MKTFRKPKVEDYDFKPYGYISDLTKYCVHVETQRNELLEALQKIVHLNDDICHCTACKIGKPAINKAI